MKNLLVGTGLVMSGTIGIVGILIASAIGGTYGSSRTIMHLNLEILFLIFVAVFIAGFVFVVMGKKESK